MIKDEIVLYSYNVQGLQSVKNIVLRAFVQGLNRKWSASLML